MKQTEEIQAIRLEIRELLGENLVPLEPGASHPEKSPEGLINRARLLLDDARRVAEAGGDIPAAWLDELARIESVLAPNGEIAMRWGL